jgi:hypothetical protein
MGKKLKDNIMRIFSIYLFLLVLFLFVLKLFFFKDEKKSDVVVKEKVVRNDFLLKGLKKEEESDPEFIDWKVVRNINLLGVYLSDIESHMPNGHGYSDKNKMTWGHETTHGINANIRNSYKNSLVNGFYLFNNRACVIEEPPITISMVAKEIPVELRGPSYSLYLVSQARSWNKRPLYLCDEWVAYTNGSYVGRELDVFGWYYELLQAHNFNVYCISMMKVIKESCPKYDDRQLRLFMMYNIKRTFDLLEKKNDIGNVFSRSGREVYIIDGRNHLHKHDFPFKVDSLLVNNTDLANAYVDKLRNSVDADGIRKFCRDYFGIDWCKKIMGF